MLCEQAKSSGIYLIGGSIPERDSSNKLYNTAIVVNRQGNIIAKHRKVHLFDIDVPGKVKFKESDSLTAGNNITFFNTEYGNIGTCVLTRFAYLRAHSFRLHTYPLVLLTYILTRFAYICTHSSRLHTYLTPIHRHWYLL